MTLPKSLKNWFDERRGIPHDLIIAGRVFGGRHGESMQQPREFVFHSGFLALKFATTELLIVEDPSEFCRGQEGQLVIPHASKAIFGWHYYGAEQSDENWCEEIYKFDVEQVQFIRTGRLSPCEETYTFVDLPFLELRCGREKVPDEKRYRGP